jgi:hypothetical protein
MLLVGLKAWNMHLNRDFDTDFIEKIHEKGFEDSIGNWQSQPIAHVTYHEMGANWLHGRLLNGTDWSSPQKTAFGYRIWRSKYTRKGSVRRFYWELTIPTNSARYLSWNGSELAARETAKRHRWASPQNNRLQRSQQWTRTRKNDDSNRNWESQ